MFLLLYFCFLLVSLVLAVPVENENCTDDKPIIYTAWARSPTPLQDGEQATISGLEKPLRRNGTWIDVGVWESREDIISKAPFLFTLSSGRDSETHTIVPYSSSSLFYGNKTLAYSEGDLTLPVNYGSLSAFILTDEGNTDTQVVDDWTVEKDEYGRLLLRLAQTTGNGTTWGAGGRDWTLGGCAWTNGTDALCDGFYFMNCDGCFGTPAVIEVVEYKV